MCKYSVDRIENNILICYDDNDNKKEIPLSQCQIDVKEGDIIEYIDGKYIVNKQETQKRKDYIYNLSESLFE
ncbi:MAG: DUF3006 domain-containing protein [Oscillospiraceae bacterium]